MVETTGSLSLTPMILLVQLLLQTETSVPFFPLLSQRSSSQLLIPCFTQNKEFELNFQSIFSTSFTSETLVDAVQSAWQRCHCSSQAMSQYVHSDIEG